MPEHIYITRQGDKIQATQVGIMIDELTGHQADPDPVQNSVTCMGFYGDSNDNSFQFTFTNPNAGDENPQGTIGQFLQPLSNEFLWARRVGGRSGYRKETGSAFSVPLKAFSPCREWTITATFLTDLHVLITPNGPSPNPSPIGNWHEITNFPDIGIAFVPPGNFQPGNTFVARVGGTPAAYAGVRHEVRGRSIENSNLIETVGFRQAGHVNYDEYRTYPNSGSSYGSLGNIPEKAGPPAAPWWDVEIVTTLRWIPLGSLTGRLEAVTRFTALETGQTLVLPVASSGTVCNHFGNCDMSLMLSERLWLEQLAVN